MTTVAAMWPMFKSSGSSVMENGQGTIYATTLDRDTPDFGHIIGCEVIVDGELVTVTGVERFAHCPPWHAGERIGLLVKR